MIVLDNETTGLDKPELAELKEQPYITEFAAVKFDKEFNVVDKIETLMRPLVPIPEYLEQKIGITNEAVKNAPTFIQAYDDIANFFIGETILVAHNASFDTNILKFELMRHSLEFKFPWPKHHICTVEKSYHLENRRLRLGYLYEKATGKKLEGWHRAMNDVLGTLECFKYLVNEGCINLDDYQ